MVLVAVGEGLGLDVEYLLPEPIVVVHSTANGVRSALKEWRERKLMEPGTARNETPLVPLRKGDGFVPQHE